MACTALEAGLPRSIGGVLCCYLRSLIRRVFSCAASLLHLRECWLVPCPGPCPSGGVGRVGGLLHRSQDGSLGRSLALRRLEVPVRLAGQSNAEQDLLQCAVLPTQT